MMGHQVSDPYHSLSVRGGYDTMGHQVSDLLLTLKALTMFVKKNMETKGFFSI